MKSSLNQAPGPSILLDSSFTPKYQGVDLGWQTEQFMPQIPFGSKHRNLVQLRELEKHCKQQASCAQYHHIWI
ncbi:unnamed protein product [Lota lota]